MYMVIEAANDNNLLNFQLTNLLSVEQEHKTICWLKYKKKFNSICKKKVISSLCSLVSEETAKCKDNVKLYLLVCR